MRMFLTPLAVAVAIVGFARDASAQETRYRDRVDTAVTLEPGGTLSVSLHSGRVNVVGSGGSQVRIRGMTIRENFTVRSRSNSVTVTSEPGWHSHAGAELDISVPRGTRVVLEGFSVPFSVRDVQGEASVESLSGSIVVSNARGRVTLESVSGNISASNVVGTVSAESVNGRVEITNVDGDINAESVSGSIDIAGAKSMRVTAETVQGPLSYDGTIERAGTYSFTTHAGRITLAVPATAGATVSLETFSGDIESDFPVTLESGANRREGESQFDFRIGDGRSRIILETFSGDIRIQRGSSRRE